MTTTRSGYLPGATSESEVGRRDDRGHWRPDYRLTMPAHCRWPLEPRALARWFFGFPGYLWPWNLVYLAIPVLAWFYLTPPLETMRTLEPGWMAIVLGRNLAITAVWFGAWHLWLYGVRGQGREFKYNPEAPATGSRRFLFGRQVADNVFYTLAVGVPAWSAYEIGFFWAYANGWLPTVDFASNPVWFVLMFFLVPVLRDAHFYFAHRLLHWKPLYDAAHYLHHRNVNIGPWSGMAMHPIEHVLYFSGVLVHLVLPSHPVHMMFTLFHTGLSPAKGHCGFERLTGGGRSLGLGNYFHYLHHTNFECNYGSDGMPLLDKLFGSFHDGSPEADRRLRESRIARARAARVAG